jgi:hypothetical protein
MCTVILPSGGYQIAVNKYLIYINRSFDGHTSPSGGLGEDIGLLLLPGIQPRLLGHPARSLVAIPTSIFQLPWLSWQMLADVNKV